MLRFVLVLFIALGANVTTAYADSCQTLLCMAGMLEGQSGGSDCSGPIGDYFSILKFGKHGKFSPSKTAGARLSFLNQCPATDVGNWPSEINAVYGTVFSL